MSDYLTLAQTLFPLILGGGAVSAVVAWRKDRREATRDDLTVTEMIRELARKELAEAMVKIEALEAKVASLSRESSAAQQYIATFFRLVADPPSGRRATPAAPRLPRPSHPVDQGDPHAPQQRRRRRDRGGPRQDGRPDR